MDEMGRLAKQVSWADAGRLPGVSDDRYRITALKITERSGQTWHHILND